ncbi:MAG: RHS repeat-associated core domain-containing protein [Lachnospiraceae bacterium]
MLKIGAELIKVAGDCQKYVDSKEYLVEGAKLVCVHGNKITVLQVPENHNYTSGGRKKANCKDCKACENIEYFGNCRKNEDTNLCEGFMSLEEQWENTAISGTMAEQVSGEEAITMSSVLLCKKGGIIIPVTSGQGYDEEINWGSFLLRLQNVLRWAAGKNLLCHIFGKDPINLNTGNYIYEKEGVFIDGAMPISFYLFYNAMSCRDSSNIGEGWNHNYDMWLDQVDGQELIAVNLGDGKEMLYHRDIQGGYKALMGDLGTLKQLESGYEFETQEGLLLYFNVNGQLLRQFNRDGNGIYFDYDENQRLKNIKNGSGRGLHFTYNPEGKLIEVSDHTGRRIVLRYEYGKLCSYTDVEGNQVTYDYNENGKLNEIFTPEGKSAIKNEYDGADRVIRQIMPNGAEVELRHDDQNNRTYMKEENGNMVIFESDKMQRNIKTIYEDGDECYTYNDKNQKTLYTDKNGNITRYSYDNRGNLTKIIDALGQISCMTYDSSSHLVKLKYPDGTSIKCVYNEKGKPIEVIDRGGNLTKIEYGNDGNMQTIIQPDHTKCQIECDSAGDITKVTDAAGTVNQYSYNELGQLASEEDGNGNVTQFHYTPKGDIKEIINAAGDKRSFEYNFIGRVTQITDFDGSIISKEYDECGRCCKHTDPEGHSITYGYNEMGMLSQETLPNGGTYTYSYNPLGNLQTVTDPLGNVSKYSYDPNGNCIKVAASNGNETLYAYDALNRVVSITESDGLITYYGYNQDNFVSKISDNYRNQASIEYNYMGRPVKVTDVYGNCTTYSYDCFGQVVRMKDGAGRETAYSYYPGKILKKIDYFDGLSQTFWHDKNKNMIKTENQDHFVVNYTYDCLDRLTKVVDSMGRVKTYTFDKKNNVTSAMNANGNITSYEYSANGNLKKITDPLGNITDYEYDSTGSLISSTRKGKGQEETIKYQRNLMGKIKAVTNSIGNTEYYDYDSTGHMISKLDREGAETCYNYLPTGQLERIQYADGKQVNLKYDSLRRLIEVEDWLGSTKLEWSTYMHLRSVTDYKGRKLSYDFTPMGLLSSMVYPDGRSVTYTYDNCLRLSELSDSKNNIRYQYEKGGLLRDKIFSDGLKSSYSYNQVGQLVKLTNFDNKRIIDEYSYSYDPVGNKAGIKKVREGVNTDEGFFQYEYNPLNQLIKVLKEGREIREYQYDEMGNRIAKIEGGNETVYSYNQNNQLMQETGAEVIDYSYDLRGNLTEVAINGVTSRSYEFDASNRLRRAFNENGLSAIYDYNGLGHRIGKQVLHQGCTEEMEEIEYVVDFRKRGRNLLQTIEKKKTEDYIWDESIVSSIGKEHSKNFLNDELGSTIRTYINNGGESGSYGYDEFGNMTHKSENRKQPFGFTGYQWDETSSTYYAQAREYSPTTGTFISEDTVHNIIGLPGTLNSYVYCWGNPCRWVDVNGLFSQSDANKLGFGYYADQFESGINEIKDDISNAISEVGDQIAGSAVGQVVGNGAIAVGTAVTEFWNENIYGVDTLLYKDGDTSVKTHTGGNVIVNDVNIDDIRIGWKFNVSVQIPLIDITVGSSLSGKYGDLSTLKTKDYLKWKVEDGTFSIGFGFNKDGIYTNKEVTISENLDSLLPNGLDFSTYTNVRWIYSKDFQRWTWNEIRNAVAATFLTIGIIGGCIFLFSNPLTAGVASWFASLICLA